MPTYKDPPCDSPPVRKLTRAQLRAVYLEAADRIHCGANRYACTAASFAAGSGYDAPNQPQTRLIWDTFAPHIGIRSGAIWADPYVTLEDQEARILGLLLLREMLKPKRKRRPKKGTRKRRIP